MIRLHVSIVTDKFSVSQSCLNPHYQYRIFVQSDHSKHFQTLSLLQTKLPIPYFLSSDRLLLVENPGSSIKRLNERSTLIPNLFVVQVRNSLLSNPNNYIIITLDKFLTQARYSDLEILVEAQRLYHLSRNSDINKNERKVNSTIYATIMSECS